MKINVLKSSFPHILRQERRGLRIFVKVHTGLVKCRRDPLLGCDLHAFTKSDAVKDLKACYSVSHEGKRLLPYLFAVELVGTVQKLYLNLRKTHELSLKALLEELIFLDYLVTYGYRSGRSKTAHFRRGKLRSLGKDLQDIFAESFCQCLRCGLAKPADVISKKRCNKKSITGILIHFDLLQGDLGPVVPLCNFTGDYVRAAFNYIDL